MEEIADQVWRIALMPRDAVNAYVIGDVLIDAGYLMHGKKVVGALGDHAIGAHALTHVHNDHTGGSKHVKEALGVPVWIGAGDAPYLRSGRAPVPPGTRFGSVLERTAGSPRIEPDRELREGDEVGPGFVVLETPGHSPGHVSYWREADRVLICGDVFFGMNVVTLAHSGLREPLKIATYDPPLNRRSERRLAELEPAVVLFGHGPPLRDPAALHAFCAGLPAD